MNTKFVLISLLMWSSALVAQQDLGVGLLPNWNYGVKLNKNWKINGKVEGRFNAFRRDSSNGLVSNWGFELLDIQAGASYKTRPNQSVNLSALLRYRNGVYFYRSILQYTLAKNLRAFKLGQRFRTDQTFSRNGFEEVRLRYRLTFITPFFGQVLDAREPYLKINNEYLLSYTPTDLSAEFRIQPGVGFAFSDQNKLEGSLDYRLGDIFQANIDHNIWLNIGWYYTFN